MKSSFILILILISSGMVTWNQDIYIVYAYGVYKYHMSHHVCVSVSTSLLIYYNLGFS